MTQKIRAKDDSGVGVVTLSPYGASSSTATRSPFPSLGKATLALLATEIVILCAASDPSVGYASLKDDSGGGKRNLLATEILVSDVRSEREEA